MSLLDFVKGKGNKDKNQLAKPNKDINVTPQTAVDAGRLAELALKSIQDGVIIINKDGLIKFINPAAVMMTGVEKEENALNLEFPLVLKLEFLDGTKVDSSNNDLEKAARANQQFESKKYVIIGTLSDKKTPVRIVLTPTGGAGSDRIITFKDIAKELEEEGAQAEFVSTASHEMRTPIASIEGYLSLALNPQTATIDARARQYIESAHDASQRLGNLFKDLLDVTKLDDKRVRARMVPVELTSFVKKFVNEYLPKFKEKNITYTFGTEESDRGKFSNGGIKKLEQVVYCSIDVDFMGEIIANLIENAIKYTPVGGAIWVNVRGDGDQALLNVTDTGIGIAPEDLQHIFQKFYRADNSQTRTVGGTGLGLYLVKQRVEIMEGRDWAESAFGEGSTFFVSLPRLSNDEYEKRMIQYRNQRAVEQIAEQKLSQNIYGNAMNILQGQNPMYLGAQGVQATPQVQGVQATPQVQGVQGMMYGRPQAMFAQAPRNFPMQNNLAQNIPGQNLGPQNIAMQANLPPNQPVSSQNPQNTV